MINSKEMNSIKAGSGDAAMIDKLTQELHYLISRMSLEEMDKAICYIRSNLIWNR